MKVIGFGYVVWVIIIGLLISNIIGIFSWVKFVFSIELYIKIGLVLLGVEILLGKIFVIGLLGIFVVWIVMFIVLISIYWFG